MSAKVAGPERYLASYNFWFARQITNPNVSAEKAFASCFWAGVICQGMIDCENTSEAEAFKAEISNVMKRSK